jgi:hypothetical protein
MSRPRYHAFAGGGEYCEAYDERYDRVCGFPEITHPDPRVNELPENFDLHPMTFKEHRAQRQAADPVGEGFTYDGPAVQLLKAHTLTEQRWCGACKRFAIGQAEHTVQVLSENGYSITRSS